MSSPKAQDADLLDIVHECDVLAAHPSDVQRVADGVADDRIISRLAIRACEQAIKENAPDPRFAFQLGRALLAAGRTKDAAQAFEKATDANYAAAWAYLGDAYQFGHNGPIDWAKAHAAYTKALQGGFLPAKALVEVMMFDKDGYAQDVIAELYRRNVDEINVRSKQSRKWETRGYVFSLTQKLMAECDRVLSPGSVPALFHYRYGDGWTVDADAPASVAAFIASGDFDAKAFLRRHGCDGPVALQLFASIDGLLKLQVQ